MLDNVHMRGWSIRTAGADHGLSDVIQLVLSVFTGQQWWLLIINVYSPCS